MASFLSSVPFSFLWSTFFLVKNKLNVFTLLKTVKCTVQQDKNIEFNMIYLSYWLSSWLYLELWKKIVLHKLNRQRKLYSGLLNIGHNYCNKGEKLNSAPENGWKVLKLLGWVSEKLMGEALGEGSARWLGQLFANWWFWKLGFYPLTGALSFWIIIFQRYGSQVFEKDIPAL